MRRIVLVLTAMMACVGYVAAQVDDDAVWNDMMELWADQNDVETIPDDLAERLQELYDNPVNLNDTSTDNLLKIPFLNDFQLMALRAHIQQNGQMVSLNELYSINGFDTNTIRALWHCATTEPLRDSERSLGELLKQGHHNLVVGTKRAFPLGRGYQEDVYLGSPFRLYFRYNYKSGDRISFQVSGDKDPGEVFGFDAIADKRQYGFDYYGYHLMLNDFGRLKKVIVGKYQLQFGQGATLWSGYAPWMTDAMPLRRYGMGIRPASAFCEYGYLRGVATTLSLLPKGRKEELEMTLFYSNVDRDATAAVADSSDDAEQSFRSIYQSGYHRTETEFSKKGNLNEQLYGGNLQYRDRHFNVGATAYATSFGTAIVPVENVYNYYAFRGKKNFNAGVDATYSYRNFLVFGEASMSSNEVSYDESATQWLPMSAVVGTQMHFSSDNMISLAYRYGSPTYHNFHADVIGQGSSVANEESFVISMKARLPQRIHLVSSVFFSRYPALRYNVYAPSSGVDYRLNLSREIARHTLLDVKYRYRRSQRNSAGQMYALETVGRQQFQVSLNYSPLEHWHFLSRIVFSRSSGDESDVEHGSLVFQELSWNGDLFGRQAVFGARLSLFDVSDYDARIYSYESDLQYEYGVPMLMGRGLRGFVVCRYSVSPRVRVSLKYTMSYYPDQETVGTGYEKIEGNKKHEVRAQLRWVF